MLYEFIYIGRYGVHFFFEDLVNMYNMYMKKYVI